MPTPPSLIFPELKNLGQVPHWDFLEASESCWSTQGIFHVLVVLPNEPSEDRLCPAYETYAALSQRGPKRGKKDGMTEVKKFSPQVAMTPEGVLVSWVWLDETMSTFQRTSRLRQALKPLLEEEPTALAVWCAEEMPPAYGQDVVLTATVNGAALPHYHQEGWMGVQRFCWQGVTLAGAHWRQALELAAANTLVRALTVLPPNRLDPQHYRQWIEAWAQQEGWHCTVLDLAELKRRGAEAFLAVARGSAQADGCIVQLRYRQPQATRNVALVGKGICFDTGGANLKPAKYMWDMHGDMNGSAVALGILQVLSRLEVPLNVDVWLAMAQNSVGPLAYRQNEVLTTLSGTTLEVVHTDAEGRLVLADTLSLATQENPQLVMDFATLTGSMHTALGSRYSGAFARPESLVQAVQQAGQVSGERMLVFPQDEDYDEALESSMADLKQCTLEGEADHILATRLLGRFVRDIPWIHVDLSAAVHSGGLGAVGSDVTGFGVRWGWEFLDKWCNDPI